MGKTEAGPGGPDHMGQIRREAMEFAGIGLYRFGFDGVVLDLDMGAFQIFELEGFFDSPAAAAGKNIRELLNYIDKEGLLRKEVQEQERVRGRLWHFRTLGGRDKAVLEDSYLVGDGSSEEAVIQVVVRDVTEQHNAELELRRREAILRALAGVAEDFLRSVSWEERIDPVLQRLAEATEVSRVYIFQSHPGPEGSARASMQYEWCSPGTAPQMGAPRLQNVPLEDTEFREWFEQLARGELICYHRRELSPKLQQVIVEAESVLLVPIFAYGELWGLIGFDECRHERVWSATEQDALRAAANTLGAAIEQRQSREDLRESEEKYRDILENIQEGYYEVSLRGDFTFFNEAMCQILGYLPEEMGGLNYRAYYPNEEAAARAAAVYGEVYRTGRPVLLQDWRLVRKDGAQAELEVSVSAVRDSGGKITGFRGIVRDVTERRNAEDALRKAEARYRELFENANDIVYTHDLDGWITSFNKAGEIASGYTRDEVRRVNAMAIIAPEFIDTTREMIQKKLEEDRPTRYEAAIVAKDGRRIPIEVSTRLIMEDGTPVGIQGIARDITERKEAEEERKRLESQILHSQKLESLGVLAGGIAHDFNNLLVGVLGNAGLAMGRLPKDSPARDYVTKIEDTAQRAAELTNQMLAYSGQGAFNIRPVDLSSLAEEMGQLLAASISKKATLRFECSTALPLTSGDTAQVHQVLMNLITNASDALGNEPGVITVGTGTRSVDDSYLLKTYLKDPLKKGEYVFLEVSDTGCGMDADTQARIFDPFFSTKFAGRGLGLAATLGIVRSHNGAITVYSEPGHGSTFRVLLPVTDTAKAVPQKKARGKDTDWQEWRSTGTILVADDEPAVIGVAKETLAGRGLTVLTAADGEEAVACFKEHSDEIRAVLLDLLMPKMNGDEVYRRIQALRPEVPVVLSSGYTEQDTTERFAEQKPSAFIQKPYLPRELIGILREVMEEED